MIGGVDAQDDCKMIGGAMQVLMECPPCRGSNVSKYVKLVTYFNC
jgi:hypothetical protein